MCNLDPAGPELKQEAVCMHKLISYFKGNPYSASSASYSVSIFTGDSMSQDNDGLSIGC